MANKEKKPLDPTLVAVGRRIRSVRQAKKLTMEQVAEAADTSTQFLSKVEKGEQGMTTVKFANLTKALGVSSDFLLFGREPHSEQTALLAELISQIPPVDRMLLIELMGTAGRLLDEIRPNIERPGSH